MTKRNILWRIAGAFIGIAPSMTAAACSSGGSNIDAGVMNADASPTSEAGAVTATTACGDSAHAMCTKMQTCVPGNLQSTYGDEASCEVLLNAACLDAIGSPGSGSTPATTEACAQAYAGYACSDYRNKTNIPAACAQATGSKKAGDSCEHGNQCQTGFCAILPGMPCGSCANPPNAGDSCAQLTSCGPTLTCTNDTLVCTTFATLNGACGRGQPCGAGLSCVAPGGSGTMGTCQTAGAQTGVACDGSSKTAPGCDGALGLFCDGVTKQCGLATYAGSSQPCGYDADAGTSVQCTAGTCQGANASQHQLGSCLGRAAENGACSVPDGGAATSSAGCLPPARCVADSGTCQTVTGASCM